MAITYPAQCNTDAEKVEFIEEAKETIRLIHNFMGYWHGVSNSNLTSDQYNNGLDASLLYGTSGRIVKLPDKLKAVYPFSAKLSDADWQKFRQFYMEKRSLIENERGRLRNVQKDAAKWSPKVEDF